MKKLLEAIQSINNMLELSETDASIDVEDLKIEKINCQRAIDNLKLEKPL